MRAADFVASGMVAGLVVLGSTFTVTAVAEEESAEARGDGQVAIRKNRTYMQSIGY